MIVRLWRGTASRENAPAYRHHFSATVAPQLRALPGHCGAWLLQRDGGHGVELLAMTLWDSLEAIRSFAGADAEAAVVEPAARAVLADAAPRARHYQVVHQEPAMSGTEPLAGQPCPPGSPAENGADPT